MKPRFEPDNPSSASDELSPTLIDPEAFDASEQRFAASLERTASRTPRFVVEEDISEGPVVRSTTRLRERLREGEVGSTETLETATPETKTQKPELQQTGFEENGSQEKLQETEMWEAAGRPQTPAACEIPADPESWRREVAARLSHYRARRRTREPRYPSLQLKFEAEPVWADSIADADGPATPAGQASPMGDLPSTPVPQHAIEPVLSASSPRIRLAEPVEYPRALFPATREATAKVIEFASYSAPSRPFDELAEPVFDRPRIIEAPELVPPPPALGGISIEPVEEPVNDRRPGFEIPLRAAPMGRRVAAAGIDAMLVTPAITVFAYIFFRISAERPLLPAVAATTAFLAGTFWCAYQYLLLVYSGTTPGLKLAKLELQRFDGDAVPRRLRRWRVLASVLSGASLGLGYAWCLLDEDQLCWHDRITRTYMAPRK